MWRFVMVDRKSEGPVPASRESALRKPRVPRGRGSGPAPVASYSDLTIPLPIYFAFKAATTSSRTFLASPNSIWLFSL